MPELKLSALGRQSTVWLEAALVIFIATAGLFGHLLRADRWDYLDPHFNFAIDHHKYLWMATNDPFGFHIAPFNWRVLNPFLAKILPFGTAENFSILSFAALWMTLLVLYLVLKNLGFSRALALTGLLYLLTLGWAVRFNLNDFWLSDPLAILFSIATLWAIIRRRDFLFVALLTIGVTAKESVLFVAPLYYTFNAQQLFDRKLLWRTLLLTLPAVLALVALRLSIPALNDDSQYLLTLGPLLSDGQGSPYSMGLLFQTIGLARFEQLMMNEVFLYTAGTFGVSLLLFAVLALSKPANVTLALKFLPFVLLVYSSLLFATDVQRLLVPAFMAVIPIALCGIEQLSNVLGVRSGVFFGLPIMVLALLLVEQELYMVSAKIELPIMVGYIALVWLGKLTAQHIGILESKKGASFRRQGNS